MDSPESPKCPKCGSFDVMKDLRMRIGRRMADLRVEVQKDPRAPFFRDEVYGEMFATVCGDCGFTEFYVTNSREMLEAYRFGQTRYDLPAK